ncbi:SET domain-containing protein [Apiospora saccharicola]|uniref:SET domain-containing protein n=1 Tax=Apiospora saccharicola TaxID=335842 RepID=A0ABR1WMZ3_9PEZI
MSHPVNDNVSIRLCGSPERGLGLFASRRISQGLKILSEEPFLVDESRQDMVGGIAQEFPALPLHVQALFTRLYAGPSDLVPVLNAGPDRDQRSVAIPRLQRIVELNSVEGAGTGCFLSPAVSTVNHDCIPNAFVYYNYESGLVALHALRVIEPNEEVTVDYLQDSIYLDSDERQDRLVD